MAFKPNTRLLKILILVFIYSSLFFFMQNDSMASATKKTTSKHKVSKKSKKKSRRKRHYVPDVTRAQAIETIRTNSESISELAGLDPIKNDALKTTVTPAFDLVDEGEDMDDIQAQDDVNVDIESFRNVWFSYIDDTPDDMMVNGIKKSSLMSMVMDKLGTPYHFGGSNADRGIDCSAFVRFIFQTVSNTVLPRTAHEQYYVGKPITRRNLQFGDLVFFHTRRSVYVSHVGIYLGDNLFAHSSSRFGVTVSSLESTYYNEHFIGGRRLRSSDLAKLGAVVTDNEKDE